MKKLLAIAVSTAVLSGCSSMNLNPFNDDNNFVVSQSSDAQTPVKEQTVGLVNDNGIKIYYTLTGNLDRIEVHGVAPAWKGNVEVVAEADAKERLVKYLYEERVDSQRNVEVITRTLDKARDNALNKIENGLSAESIVEFDQEQIEAEVAQNPSVQSENNTSRRVAERIEETTITALTKITSSGTLRGLRKIRSETRDSGKVYVAVYRWSEEDQNTAKNIKNLMFAK